MAAEFRTRFRTGIQAIAARGVGRIMARSGYYSGGNGGHRKGQFYERAIRFLIYLLPAIPYCLYALVIL